MNTPPAAAQAEECGPVRDPGQRLAQLTLVGRRNLHRLGKGSHWLHWPILGGDNWVLNSTQNKDRRHTECFLCDPECELVYARVPNFYAMLGLGPLVEGYSLIAATDHLPSMLDLPHPAAIELAQFTECVRDVLRPHYGDVIVTEHGRVSPCEIGPSGGREQHCFHAHRLVFPVNLDLAASLEAYDLRAESYASFLEAHARCPKIGEYLYYERSDGSCVVALTPGSVQRQFFRHVIAEHLSLGALVSWRRFPRDDIVDAARRRLAIGEEGLSRGTVGSGRQNKKHPPRSTARP